MSAGGWNGAGGATGPTSGARIFRVRSGTIIREGRGPTCELAALMVGERGRVVRVKSANARLLQKLLAMAVLPGSEVTVNLTFPAFVLEVGNTRVAIDRSIARQIEVERLTRLDGRPRNAGG
ncbi:MAG TPA: ferrous iron transport protein A [Firmicutes bacterium]|nr:ferrous iron transport protein A [Bacillota bacterium]